MKKVIIAMMLLLASLTAMAQTTKINGNVIDSNNQPVAFVNVSIVSLPDSAFVTGSTTDTKGGFSLKAKAGTDLLLKISYIGYSTEQIEIKNPHGNVQMGNIVLSEELVALNEVVVSASTITQKVDRMLIIPTSAALKTAYNPYDLMFNLAIPHLQVNPLNKSLEANGNEVQTRINGIVANQTEVAAILPKNIVRIEFIENPGERYGDNTLGAVVNIIVRQHEAGGLVNIQTENSPHTLFGNNSIVAKYNNKKSQWGVFYNMSDRGLTSRSDVNEEYLLETKNIRRVQEGINNKSKFFEHNLDLSYNLSEPDKYVFNVMFRNRIYDVPRMNQSSRLYDAANPDNSIFSKLRSEQSSYTPSLDLYYQRSLPHGQTLTANVTGTLIHSTSDRRYSEFSIANKELAAIETDVTGNKRSIIGEAIYDKQFKSAVLSAGIRHYQMYAENKYTGSSPVTSEMNQAKSSAFADFQGSIQKKISYGISAGLTRSYFEEGGLKHTYYTFTPTIRVNFAPHKNGNINYRFNTEPTIPSLSSLTDVEQAVDTIQIVRGNPALKTYSVYNNTLNYSYIKGRFMFIMSIAHSYRDNSIMESVFAEGDKLISMEENQRSHQMLSFQPTFIIRGLDVGKLKNFLTLSLEGGFVRYWSNGNSYTHTYNNFYYNLQAMFNYKQFALMGQFCKNKHTLWGETITKGENITGILASYTHKRFQLGAGMLFPFTNNYKTGKERVSKVAPYSSWAYVKETGQMVILKLSYNFEFGKKYNAARKRTNNSDNESGILNVDK